MPVVNTFRRAVKRILLWIAELYRQGGRRIADAREDEGLPRRGSRWDGFGIAGMGRSALGAPKRQRRSFGKVTSCPPDVACIWGPGSHGELRERCFRIDMQTQGADPIELGHFVTIVHRGPQAIRIEQA